MAEMSFEGMKGRKKTVVFYLTNFFFIFLLTNKLIQFNHYFCKNEKVENQLKDFAQFFKDNHNPSKAKALIW